MKTILYAIIGIAWAVSTVLASETDDTYLKIRMSNDSEINYPPGTRFIAEDGDGNMVLSPKELEEKQFYDVKAPITLWVFVDWKDEPDVIEMTGGKLILGSTKAFSNTKYIAEGSLGKDHYTRPSDRATVTNYGEWTGNSNGMTLDATRFFDYDDKTGYGTSLEFSDGTIFYYRDGKVNAWNQGLKLSVNGKYVIKTNEGLIKLNYNPKTKKIWWVFVKND